MPDLAERDEDHVRGMNQASEGLGRGANDGAPMITAHNHADRRSQPARGGPVTFARFEWSEAALRAAGLPRFTIGLDGCLRPTNVYGRIVAWASLPP